MAGMGFAESGSMLGVGQEALGNIRVEIYRVQVHLGGWSKGSGNGKDFPFWEWHLGPWLRGVQKLWAQGQASSGLVDQIRFWQISFPCLLWIRGGCDKGLTADKGWGSICPWQSNDVWPSCLCGGEVEVSEQCTLGCLRVLWHLYQRSKSTSIFFFPGETIHTLI